MTETPFRIEIVRPHEVWVFASPSEVNGITTYLLGKGLAAMRQTDFVAVEDHWRNVLKALLDYPGDPI